MSKHRHDVILRELKEHAPFTAMGAASGIVLMAAVVLLHVPEHISHTAFYVFHPLHVLFSSFVTAAMFWRYKRSLVLTFAIGYLGSVGIGTLSDILLPHLGAGLIGVEMGHVHVGFIEKWWLINPLALLGIGAGIMLPRTKVPHFGHVLLSTWASLFYPLSHGHAENWLPLLAPMFLVLFVAVWLPCCLSDIAFPLFFVGEPAAEDRGEQDREDTTDSP